MESSLSQGYQVKNIYFKLRFVLVNTSSTYLSLERLCCGVSYGYVL
jgi:hypothetical protein